MKVAIVIVLLISLVFAAHAQTTLSESDFDQVMSEALIEVLAEALAPSRSSSSSSSRSSPSRSSPSRSSPSRSTPSRSSPKPASRPASKPASRPATKPAARPATKPASRPATKPAAKPTKPAAKPTKPAAKPATKPTKPATKPAPKPATKPTKPAPKPATKPTKPAPKPATPAKPTKPVKSPKTPMPEVQGYPGTKIDHKFIAKQEAYKLDMYVPKRKDGTVIGKSGATIVNGLDLGQRKHLNDLKAQGLSNELAAKLTPYLGLKKEAAANYVKSHPLSLTAAEGQQLAQAVTRTYDKLAMDSFNKGKPATKFSDLPQAAQTVIASVNHQYGSLGGKATKAFYDAAKKNDWKGAAQALRNMGASEYTARRNDEANLLSNL